MDTPGLCAQPCHANCNPSVSALASSSVSEGIFRQAVALGVAPETSTVRSLPALFFPVLVFKSGRCSDIPPSVLRL